MTNPNTPRTVRPQKVVAPLMHPTTCICGHSPGDHGGDGGPCRESTGRCQCDHYTEKCPRCQHRASSHDYPGHGTCTRTRRKDGRRCDCEHYTP